MSIEQQRERTFKKINTPKTLGYFCKRLRDCGFIVFKIFDEYAIHDPRKWTILVDPGGTSVYITCFENKEFRGDVTFTFEGTVFNRFTLSTDSMEVIISELISKNVNQNAETSKYSKKEDTTNEHKPNAG